MTPAMGKAFILDRPPATVVHDPFDKMTVALDKHLGVKSELVRRACESAIFSDRTQTRLEIRHHRALSAHKDLSLRPADSLMEIYEACKMSGRVQEAQASADFANLLGNTLGRRLLAAYAESDFGERSLFLPAPATTLRDQRVVAVDESPDVPSIDAESSDYAEQVKLAERTASYSMGQRGVILSISRKVIQNDDVAVIQRMVDGLGRAARRTLARAVYAPWIANSNAPDGVAWFHSNHNNLQSAALAEAEVIAAIRKLLDQTQPGNSEKMGTRVRPGSLWLMCPTALWDTAMKLNQTTASALYRLFGDENQYVLVNPLLSDATDWGVHRDAREVESIRVSFLNGREEPELFIADVPNAGQFMVGDKLQFKLRFEFGAVVAEHRGAVKAQVAG